MWIIPESLCVQGLDDSTLELESRCRLLEFSVAWRGKPMPLQRWLRECKTGGWMLHLSGLIYEPLTASRGVAKWISSQADTPASRSVSLAKAKGKKTSGGYGTTLKELLGKSSHHSASLKMLPAIYRWDLSKLLMTWKTWDSELRRACSARKRSALRTNASDSLLWRTITASEPTGGCLTDANYQRRVRAHLHLMLRDQARQWGWPTPVSADATMGAVISPKDTYIQGKSGQIRKISSKGTEGSLGLARAVKLGGGWATPKAKDGETGMIVSPNDTFITKPSGNIRRQTKTGAERGLALPMETAVWANGAAAYSHPNQAATGQKSEMLLNPRFTEGLMGWPIGWTDLSPLGTGLCRYVRLMRLSLYLLHSQGNQPQQTADEPPPFTLL